MFPRQFRIINVSVVIPVRDELIYLKRIILSINNQSQLPKEIIIVDSSSNQKIMKYVEEYSGDVPIVYCHRQKAYPGRARNIGFQLTTGDVIAFLDSKTLPKNSWLKLYLQYMISYNSDVIFGVTQFDAISPYQKALRASTYGKIGHHSVPGTLIKAEVFKKCGGFVEHVRMGEDIEWRERLMANNYKIYKPLDPILTYTDLPSNFLSTLKKYIISTYHTARLNILNNVKDAYMTLLLILSAIILPKWNYIIGGWDTNPLFIPHVTKIYLISIVLIFLIYQLLNYILFRNISQSLFYRTMQVVSFIVITISVYNWNAVIAGWMEDAVLYFPHVTKIYVSLIIFASIIYRGIYLPFKRKVETDYLLPFRWIKVSMIGLSLDLIKAPGYILGSIIGLIKRLGLIDKIE